LTIDFAGDAVERRDRMKQQRPFSLACGATSQGVLQKFSRWYGSLVLVWHFDLFSKGGHRILSLL